MLDFARISEFVGRTPGGRSCFPRITERVRSTTLPAGRAAFVEAVGEAACYPAILRAYDAVYDWITTNGYEIDGSPRKTWRHSFPLRGAPVMEFSWKFVEIS